MLVNHHLIEDLLVALERRSDTFANSLTPNLRRSNAKAIGCPWKLPPEITNVSFASSNISGLSLA